jgi:Skp family chaperone for outer membrane proteins
MTINEISSAASGYLKGLQATTTSGTASPQAKAAASLETLFTQIQTDIQINSKDFNALKTALKANDLTAASKAFAAVQQDYKNIPTAAGVQSPLDPSTQVGKDFQALGNALNAGNLTAAQSALAAFQQDMCSVSALKGLYQDGVAAVNANSNSQNSVFTSALSKLGSGFHLNG